MKDKINKTDSIICIGLIFILLLSVIPFWLFLSRPGKEVTFDVDYADDCLFGVDYPVAGLSIQIWLDDAYLDTVITDSLGMATYYMLEDGDYSFRYNYQAIMGESIDIDDNLLAQTIDLELDTWILDDATTTFYWQHTMELIDSGTLDLYYNGVYVTSVTTTALGKLSADLAGLIFGSGWKFLGATANLTIDVFSAQLITGKTFYIQPKGMIISIIILRANNQKGFVILITVKTSVTTNSEYHNIMEDWLNEILLEINLFFYSFKYLTKNNM